MNDLESGSVDPALCLGEVVGPGRCQFHAADAGGFVTAAVGFNAIHKADFSLGFFLQGMLPVGVNFAKFEAPRLDLVAGGTQVGVHLTRWLGFENRIYIGSGVPRDERAKHNAAVAVTTLFSLEAERWILPWKAGIKVGPYIDGDLTDRVDERYEQAFTAGYPARRDPVRALRYAAAVMPYFLVTDHLAVELGIVQKIFGADVPATRAMWAGLRSVFDTRPRPAPRPAPAPRPTPPVPTPSG